jgi:hypothetical protein
METDMKKISNKFYFILLFLTILILHPKIYSQPTQEWIATYTNPFNLSVQFDDMAVDTNGNIYLTGGIIRPDSQNGNFITIKYNSSGIQQWAVEYNGPGSNSWDQGYKITVDKIGNVYVTGVSEETSLWTNAFCTIKYNSSGVQQWIARYRFDPNGVNDAPWAISIDDSGYVYVTGMSSGIGTSFDYATIKYNLNGDSVWVKRYNGNGNMNDRPSSMCLDRFGNVFVTGVSNGGTLPPHDRACTIKYNSSGVQQWVNYLVGTEETSGGGKLKLDTITNDIYVCGDIGAQFSDYLLIKYNSGGVQQWVRRYDAPSHYDDAAFDLEIDNNHNIYITGKSDISGSTDYLTIKYNSNGDSLWTKRFIRMTGEGTPPVMAIDKFNNIYITGSGFNGSILQFATFKYNSTGTQEWLMRYSDGGSKIAVDKYLNLYTSGFVMGIMSQIITRKYSQVDAVKKISNNIPIDCKLYNNYPNPFNSSTKIKYQINEKGFVRLTIYDILGREVESLVNENQTKGTYEINWNAEKLTSGIYFCKLIMDNFTETKKIVLTK